MKTALENPAVCGVIAFNAALTMNAGNLRGFMPRSMKTEVAVSKASDESVKTSDAEILADLARVKAVFQMRTLEAIIRGPSVIQGQSTGDVG